MNPKKIKAKFIDQQLDMKYDGLEDELGFFTFRQINSTFYLLDSEDRFNIKELWDFKEL